MSNQIVKVNQMSVSETMSMAEMFYKSGLFKDVSSLAQCVVKIQAGAEIGLPPFASMTGISVIKGKPVIGAGVMASKIKASAKYDYKIIELSNTKCSIDFLLNGELIDNSTFTIEDAKRAGTGAGDNGSGKMIDKFPKNMLFARALSNGVKFYCPDLFLTSFYEPGEMGSDIVEDDHDTATLALQEESMEYSRKLIRIEKLKKSVEESFSACTYDLEELREKAEKYMTTYPNEIQPETDWFVEKFEAHKSRIKQTQDEIDEDNPSTLAIIQKELENEKTETLDTILNDLIKE